MQDLCNEKLNGQSSSNMLERHGSRNYEEVKELWKHGSNEEESKAVPLDRHMP